MSKIIIVEGINVALDLFSEEFRKTYEFIGHEVYIVNPYKFNQTIFDELVSGEIDLVISFNYTCMALKVNGEFLVNKLTCPVVSYEVDHAFFATEKLKGVFTNKRFYRIVVDRDDLRYLNDFSGLDTSNYYLPHGGIAIRDNYQNLKDRKIDVLYVGSAKQYTKVDNDIYNYCADFVMENPNLPSTDVVIEIIKILTGANEDREAVSLIGRSQFDMLLHSECIALGHYRLKVLEELAKSGVGIVIYGTDWMDTPLSKYENVEIHQSITPYECLEKMHDSKIVLNSMPWFKDGSHERVFNAMLSGAISLSDESIWLNQNFESGKDCFIFNLEKIEEMVGLTKKVLANIEEYQCVADSGYNKAIKNHTWSHRAIELLKIANMY
ncbi:MAG: glycosyltransferase [Lachnospiraceae bacterium]|nr:glycosyltransferase [Lachnospiraceae bacterium]